MMKTDATEIIRPQWPAPHSVHAMTTTRRCGVSAPPYDSFNLAQHVGDDDACVRQNRTRLRVAIMLESAAAAHPHKGLDQPAWLEQAHGTNVVVLGDEPPAVPADGAVAFEPGRVCVVLTADCLPVLLCDRGGTRVGIAHAGWRGLASGVVEAAVAALRCPSAELIAWLGPAIGPQSYEVGEEVRAAFVAQDPDAGAAFAPNARGRWQADLYALARLRLARAGVEEVHGGDRCTYSEPGCFFSHRRDGRCGRMASLIWLT